MSQHDAYAQAGVDIAAGQRATEMMKAAVQATYTPEVLAGLGSFGGLYDGAAIKSMAGPVLVASTDGVGTKTKVAAKLDRWDTIGQDLVNHCVNDILVQGARPLFFLDYVASSKLKPEQIASIVGGVATACQSVGCVLLGGETAEMPGVYEPGEIDLVGTVVGVVERDHLIDGSAIEARDVILGLLSTGLHTNGYSLARKVLGELDWEAHQTELDGSIGEALLAVHRSYLEPVTRLQQAGVGIRGLAHITGGGVIDNLPRILPDGLGATIKRGTWPEPPIFELIRQQGDIPAAEMFHAFNMGLGMLVVVSPDSVAVAQAALEDAVFVVGQIKTDVEGAAGPVEIV
ncbi:MAG: phosphoribosylformylglycinamidine cyclo-ligase [Anaerolineae bacterium]|nr:phosphoribosylformylglycinamidine cyclo-ligase [Anaerolineae bacterium]